MSIGAGLKLDIEAECGMDAASWEGLDAPDCFGTPPGPVQMHRRVVENAKGPVALRFMRNVFQT